MKVSIYIRIKTAAGWRYAEPVISGNNRLKPQCARIDGQEQHCPEGVYFLRYKDANGRRVWERVGTDATAVFTVQRNRQRGDTAPIVAIEPTTHPTTDGLSLREQAAEYLAEVKVSDPRLGDSCPEVRPQIDEEPQAEAPLESVRPAVGPAYPPSIQAYVRAHHSSRRIGAFRAQYEPLCS
jgi:hypothetical protein